MRDDHKHVFLNIKIIWVLHSPTTTDIKRVKTIRAPLSISSDSCNNLMAQERKNRLTLDRRCLHLYMLCIMMSICIARYYEN